MSAKKIILTGIKPTGMPHLGNYSGAIRPALKKANNPHTTSYLFIADYHSLTTVHHPEQLSRMIYEASAAWLACGLDPKQTIIYRQSDIPELFELNWILSCITAKGLMNRAHSYKAFMQQTFKQDEKNPENQTINMGVYNYPILMASDILLFSANEVPVSTDQAQHLEIARDLALKFNHIFKTKLMTPPIAGTMGDLLPGLNGQKMSKSTNNHIPLFCSSEELKKLVRKIKTDSSDPKVSKDPAKSILFNIYKAFASIEQVQKLSKAYAQGIGWGEVKDILYHQLETALKEKRNTYQDLIKQPEKINRILQDGAKKARKACIPFMQKIRQAIGIT